MTTQIDNDLAEFGIEPGNNGHAQRHQLYRVPDVLAADRVYIVESKEAADAARTIGLTATTSPHGAKSAGKIDWSPLADKAVVVLPDHDAAGETYARDIARLALAAGAKSVRIVPMAAICPGRALRSGYDLADAATECPDDDERMGLRMAVEQAEDETPCITSEALRAEEAAEVEENENVPEEIPEGNHKPESPSDNGEGILDVGRKRPEFQRITCHELDSTTYELDYLIDKTLVAGQPCILAAAKKMMKTSMVIDMGLSLAMGGYFLGKLKVNRACRVGIMSGESGMAVIQETARRICFAAGYHLGDVSNLIFCSTIPQLDNPGHLVALRQFIENDELEVLIIDPTYLAMQGADAGNLFIQGAMLRTVNEVCMDMGVTLILASLSKRREGRPIRAGRTRGRRLGRIPGILPSVAANQPPGEIRARDRRTPPLVERGRIGRAFRLVGREYQRGRPARSVLAGGDLPGVRCPGGCRPTATGREGSRQAKAGSRPPGR